MPTSTLLVVAAPNVSVAVTAIALALAGSCTVAVRVNAGWVSGTILPAAVS